MDMLVQVCLKSGQSFVQRLIADAGIFGGGKSVCSFAHCTQSIPSGIVFMFHHGNRILNGAERRWQDRFPLSERLFHAGHVGKENRFLFHQMCAELLRESKECGPDSQ